MTLVFVLIEAWVGYLRGSLALLSDAAHNFADFLALAFSLYAVILARRPSDSKRTYGYHRAGILAALANAVSLIVMAVLIFWEAAVKLRQPAAEIEPTSMVVLGACAILMNGAISLILRRQAHSDLNARSAYLHMLGDALSAVGVMVAGAVIRYTGYTQADPIASILIGILILGSSWNVLVEAVNVLLEGVPHSIQLGDVQRIIKDVDGVLDIHDLHVWTVTSGILAASCHIEVSEQSIRSGQQILKAVKAVLESHFGIGHTTIQVEVEGCDPNDIYCTASSIQHSQKSRA
jgi:cobalt-zinc-cadmium efflux system protein